ncbi:MAG TPA: TolC family protein [Polyangia bacterium]|nr:TolC family protein [Polyangia bacterium]
MRSTLAKGVAAGALIALPVLNPVARAEKIPAPPAEQTVTASASVKELTLEQALAMAKRGNRSLAVDRTRLAQAKVSIDQAWSVLFPTVVAQGKYSRNNTEFVFALPGAGALTIQPYNQLDGAISASTLLFAPAVYPGLKAVEAGFEAAEEGNRASEDAVLYAVGQTFYAALIADEVMVARDSNIAVTQATLETAKTRFAAGAVTKLDVDRAELALLRAQQAKREAELGRAQYYRALATLIGAEGSFRVAAPTGADADSSGSVGNDLDLVLKLRPEFRALDAAAREAELERKAYLWRWAPSISAFGNARAFNYDNFARQNHAWVVGATLDWVLYDGGSRDNQRHLQLARLAESQARAEQLRESIRDDLANGKDTIATKRQAQLTAERSVTLAQETVDLTRTQYEAGSATQIDVLQAQDALIAAKDALARSHFDVALADLSLRRAAGTFPPR